MDFDFNEEQKILQRTLRNTKIAKGLVNDILEVGRSTQGISKKDRFLLSDIVKHPLVELFDLFDHNVAENIKACVNLPTLKEALLEKDILLNIDDDLWSQEPVLPGWFPLPSQ